MKKASIFLICAIMLTACSISAGQSSTPAPTLTEAPTEIPSSTPTIPTPTYTSTPTLVGLKTPTRTPDFTPTVASETPFFLITPNTATPSVQMEGFISVSVSETEFYKPGGCEPVSVKFSAQAGDSVKTAYVLLSVRFKSKETGTTSKWTTIAMQTLGAGTYTHELFAEEMKGVDSYKNAWVQYQFVATDSKTSEIGRTAVFGERLTLLDCEPPTPTLTLSPTATALKP